jgi:hypothetical protein
MSPSVEEAVAAQPGADFDSKIKRTVVSNDQDICDGLDLREDFYRRLCWERRFSASELQRTLLVACLMSPLTVLAS